jgi:hypothetical protein
MLRVLPRSDRPQPNKRVGNNHENEQNPARTRSGVQRSRTCQHVFYGDSTHPILNSTGSSNLCLKPDVD